MSVAQPPTAWTRGRLDARVAPRDVLFGRMYEDAEIELEAFRDGGRVFCIASAGCTALKLAPHHDVVAVDINPVQLEYARRRFQGHPSLMGKVERLVGFIRRFAPLVGWTPSTVRTFVDLDDPADQMTYWRQHLDTWRLRQALDVLFSRSLLRLVYDEQLRNNLPKPFGAALRKRMERCFERHPNRSNSFVRALLVGEPSSDPVPARVEDVRLVHADAARFLEEEPAESFDGLTLSNILDGASEAYRQRLARAVAHVARPGATVVLRSFGEADTASRFDRSASDRSMLWGRVLVGPPGELLPAT